MNWKYTNIQHAARIQLGISPNEYCVADVIYKSQTHPDFGKNGWTKIGCHKLAEFFGYSVGAVHKMLQRFEESGLLEFDGNKEGKRMTAKFYDIAYLDDADVQKVNTQKEGVQKVNTPVQKVNADRSKSEHNNISKEELVTNTLSKSEKPEIKFTLEFPEPVEQKGMFLGQVRSGDEYTVNIPADQYREPMNVDSLYESALQKIKSHFEDFPDTRLTMCETAKKKLTPEQFDFELQKWLSNNGENLGLLQNPVGRLLKGGNNFFLWLSKPWVGVEERPKSVTNGTNNRNTNQSDRYSSSKNSPFFQGLNVVDPDVGY